LTAETISDVDQDPIKAVGMALFRKRYKEDEMKQITLYLDMQGMTWRIITS